MAETKVETIPADVKNWYWGKLQKITIISFIAWLIIAVVLPVWAPLFKGVSIGNLPPLHWFIPTFVSIVAGIIIIFAYSYIMEKLDIELRTKVKSMSESRVKQVV